MNFALLFLFLLLGFGFFVLSFFFKERKIFLYTALLFLFIFAIFWRLQFIKDAPPLEDFVGQKITLKGLVKDIPDRRINNTLLTLETIDPKTRVLLSTEVFPEYHYGDLLTVTGILKKPENFETELGRIFDYKNYLAKRGIHYRVGYPVIELKDRGRGFFLKRWLFSFRETFEKKIGRVLPFEDQALLSGVLLGAQSALPEATKDDFIRSGLIHIVALSGYNITIVAEMIMRIVAFLSLRARLLVGGGVIILFVIMTGGQATAVRAGIMAGIALLARTLGRPYEALRGLFLAGLAMFFINPLVIYDPSFILSMLATFGLIYLTPKIKPWFLWIAEKKFSIEWRELVAATFATQIFVFPYLLYKIGLISLVAPLANILVLPVIPVLMLFGFFTGLFSLAWHVFALPFGFISFWLLEFILGVAKALAGLPFAVVTAAVWPLWLTLLLYGLILFLASWQGKIRMKYLEKTLDV